MSACNGTHRERLFIGEASFKGVWSLLEKHKDSHPNLGQSITATELETFDRTSDNCPKCQQKYDELSDEDALSLSIANLFLQEGETQEKVFCSDRCERIQSLKDKGVNIILGYDGTKIHEHTSTAGKIFKRIHWNCPHDKSDYRSQTLPPIIKDFFVSAAQTQQNGDRIHVTLAQPIIPHDKTKFYQGVVYNIRDAAKPSGYLLYAKRPFGSTRYPGYEHEQTGSTESAPGAERQREFVFIKGTFPDDREKSKYSSENFGINGAYTKREYYVRDTDDESSSYSSSDESD